MRVRLAAWAGALLLLAGCAESPFTPSEMQQARRALARWEGRGFTDYRFEFRAACFCPNELGQWAEVDVRGGVVVAARSVDTGVSFPGSHLIMWRTIEAHFEDLFLERDDSGLANITARFDPVLGYPLEISYTYDPGIIDAGAGFYFRNVAPLD
ncbi:MAG: DUF6174 domain-containing protein [Actinomycetota bacterium]|nr:DUF6174 domain-containing protein [Actinomycetota bacterium]